MKRAALLPLLCALAACASSSSSTGLADSRTLRDCEHGDIQVEVALQGASVGMERTEDHMTFAVSVSNNSREEVVVDAVRVESLPRTQATYQIDNSYRSFHQRIAENDEHEFELPLTGRVVGRSPTQQTTTDDPRTLELAVTVLLEGGDQYRCRFVVPAPVY
jgi:hypothetical protein